MAVMSKTVLGTPTQKIANVCFSTWRGKTCLKSLPTKYTNPDTEMQINYRTRFALLARLLAPMGGVINIGFKDRATYGRYAIDAQNAFMAYNLKGDTLVGEGPRNWEINWEKLTISAGALDGFSSQNLHLEPSSSDYNAVFQFESEDMGEDDDTVYCVCYNKVLNQCKYGIAKRVDGTCSVLLKNSWLSAGDTYCYIFASNGKKTSLSEYAGDLF